MGVDEGRNVYENIYSEMGALVYNLKYKSDRTAVEKIVNLLLSHSECAEFLSGPRDFENFDGVIIPIPPMNVSRRINPVLEVARKLEKEIPFQLKEDVLYNGGGGKELKSIEDPQERELELKQRINLVKTQELEGKSVLLIDDVYRSGLTLSVATDMLYQQARVELVNVLTMTKTRTKR